MRAEPSQNLIQARNFMNSITYQEEEEFHNNYKQNQKQNNCLSRNSGFQHNRYPMCMVLHFRYICDPYHNLHNRQRII